MTCHNRREKTLACLAALYANTHLTDATSDVFLVDDGSTDGTSDAVQQCYPNVHLIGGSGNLYWNGGMRVAFDTAMGKGFDYYLWLNDDTILYPTALPTLLALGNAQTFSLGKPTVIVGTMQADQIGAATYGGLVRVSALRPLSHRIVLSTDSVEGCETMNGNCVLIPSKIALTVGNLEQSFVHSMGDIDYGLRISKAGFPIRVMPGYAGLCAHNPVDNTFMDTRLTRRQRWSKIMSQKGLPPKQWYVLVKRHAGILWPLFFGWPYLKVILGK